MRRLAAPAAALALAIPAVALAVDSGPKITGKGAGQVKLGKRYSTLRAAGALGPKVPGCELAGPGQKGAKLKSPLVGSVDLTTGSPRKIRTITIRGGAANAKGVKVGSTVAAIESAFPNVNVDHSASGGKFEFGVSTDTGKVELIGIPGIPFCE
jgi:hypothetical protein